MAGRYGIYAKAHTDRQTEQAEELEVGSQQMAGTYMQTDRTGGGSRGSPQMAGRYTVYAKAQTDRQADSQEEGRPSQTDRQTHEQEADRKVSEQK